MSHLFHPMPIGIRYEFLDCERMASHIERVYWIMEQLTMDNYLSVRHVSKKCRCTRYLAKRALDECRNLLGVEPDTNRTATGQTDAPCALVIVDNQTPSGQQPDTNKESNLINYNYNSNSSSLTKKPLGKRCKAELITKDVAAVWNHWFELNPKARTVNGEDARCIRSALKAGYSVEDLQQISAWAHRSDDYQWQRDKGFTRCRNFLNGEKIDGNHEKAQEWGDSDTRPSVPQKPRTVRDIPNHLLNRRYGPNGHLLPSYGGKFREDGSY